MDTRQYILTIAGFDPSGGAGLISDIKTFHAHGLYGLSVCTAVTIQNDIDFKSSHWINVDIILQQIEVLFERFNIEVVKIGIIQNWNVLTMLLEELVALYPTIKIILDPVLKASAGYDFHVQEDLNLVDSILNKVYLITPNYEEIQNLYPDKSIEETIAHIRGKTNLYLKGGHRTDKIGLDQLFYNKIAQLTIEPHEINVSSKHGSGCVLSSAIASNLLLGYPIEQAAVFGKKYIEKYLSSNSTLLGNHITRI